MMTIRFPLSLRQVEELLPERGIDISYETVRAWWNRFGPLFAAEIRSNRTWRLTLNRSWMSAFNAGAFQSRQQLGRLVRRCGDDGRWA